jgi:hypothetical protein
MKKLIKYILILCCYGLIYTCIEPIEFTTNSFNTNLVVNSIITDEFKIQRIELSRTIPIDSLNLSPEKDANVSIVDDTGLTYNFQENGAGVYTSINQFAAQANRNYTLKIETRDGNKYVSAPQPVPAKSTIKEITAGIENNSLTQKPEFLFKVSSDITTNTGQYYRYEYDETYKIRTPLWNPRKIVVISDTIPYKFDLVQKDPFIDGVGFCYPNKQSKAVFLTETVSLAQDQVIGFPLRQIPIDSYIVGIRYSILVKQYVLNQNTYNFYSLMEKFSDPDDIFSQTQVGNIPSNISSVNHPEQDKVIGFFEVSSVSKKRFFVNRKDLTESPFINYELLALCTERREPQIVDDFNRSPLLNHLRIGWVYQTDSETDDPNRPYRLTIKICGDCTHLGPAKTPDFWVD